ncbi:MAG: O-antigen ligase family protein [Lachnospiraceae bacterium]|nr:O-antigen ligase family protein [Lachnospiraceae bacterium]
MKLKISVAKQTIEYFIIIFILFSPESFKYNAYINTFMQVVQAGTFLYCVLRYGRYFVKAEGTPLKRTIWFILLYAIYEFVITYYVGEGYENTVRSVIIMAALGLVLFYGLRNYPMQLLEALRILIGAYIVIDLITHLFHAQISFLYSINRIYMLFPVYGMLLYFKDEYSEKNTHIHEILFIISAFFVTIFATYYMGLGIEGNFIICNLVMIIPLLVRERKWLSINIWWLCAFIAVINFVFVYLGIQGDISVFRYIIVNILHKDINITGRTALWTESLKLIRNNWMIGIGSAWRGLSIWNSYYQPHNQFLYECIVGGIIGLCLYLAILFYAVRVISQRSGRIEQICKFVLFSMLLRSSFTNMGLIQTIPYYFILIIAVAVCENEDITQRVQMQVAK